MTDTPKASPSAVFTLAPHSASKRPEQLVNVLTRVLGQEFPDSFPQLEIVHDQETGVVTVTNLDDLDGPVAEKIAHRARTVYNEFVTSPWY